MQFNFCYDFALNNKLKNNGIPFITTAVSNDQKRFWLFWRTDEVNLIIKQYINQ
ncbi:hypothetical protein [Bacillus sp. BP-3]|uniref:hypothetical protein n=1 Tax=Bacillus sp. BP-3 TaxID=3022773 RepID=UPI00232AA8BD|nr:hypothetical protein [Bacillus sp. BP-3]MDC2866531.1 hypothetical protein [Bacillus sp. BP-3]